MLGLNSLRRVLPFQTSFSLLRQKNWQGMSTMVEHERTANALLLFYEKAVPREDGDVSEGVRNKEGNAGDETVDPVKGSAMDAEAAGVGGERGGVLAVGGVPVLDGVETFSEEVWMANAQFMLNTYVFDTDFHHFLR